MAQKRQLCFIFVVLLITIAAAAQQQMPNGARQQMTFGELGAKWWEWALLPAATHHPLFDTSDCSTGQSGAVWFLGGKFCATGNPNCNPQVAERSCEIPKGKALFFPVINTENSFLELPIGTTEADLRLMTKSSMDTATNLRATLDGRSLKIVHICSSGVTCTPVQSPLSTYTLAQDANVLAAIGEFLHLDPNAGLIPNGASSQFVSDGFYVLLDSLPVGQHTIFFHGELGTFVLDITYHLRVLSF